MREGGIVGVLVVLVCLSGLDGPAVGQETPHYVNGVEGIKAATLPPPGLYGRVYSVGYHATTTTNNSGGRVPIDFDVSVGAVSPRVIWITELDLFGGKYGLDVMVPVVHTNIDVTPPPAPGPIRDSETGIGDIWVEPLLISWHGAWYEAAIGLGFFAPTGQQSPRRAASPGKDHWTLMPTAGVTVYFDQEKTWSASILARYEVHTKKRNQNIRAGDDFHFEWGLGKTVVPGVDVGLAGYCQWQLTDDRGSDVTWNGERHDNVFAAGPEVNTFFPDLGLGVSLRVLREFGARNTSEGFLAALTVTKAF